jgi:hypothetical protein
MTTYPLRGRCTCGALHYEITEKPLFVHCCHCRWCQRETGTAFALNAMIETKHVNLLKGAPETVPTPSESGKGQKIVRCPACKVAVWSHYAGAGDQIAFVRVGTLEDPDALPPDIHIYTSSKMPWVVIPQDATAVPEYYSSKDHWPPESLARRAALKAKRTPD